MNIQSSLTGIISNADGLKNNPAASFLLRLSAEGVLLSGSLPDLLFHKCFPEQNFFQLLHPQDALRLQQHFFAAATENKIADNIALLLRERDDNWKPYQVSFIPYQATKRKTEVVASFTKLPEPAAEDSIRFMANIVNNSSEAIFTTTANLHINFWNRACEELTGITAPEILNSPLKTFFSYPVKNASFRSILASLQHNSSWKGEITLKDRRTGRTLFLLVTVIALKEANNQITRLMLFCRDVSESKMAESRLKESEQRFRLMADSAAAMIYMVDEKEWPIFFNRKWLQFTGRTQKEEIASNVNENIHPDDLERVKQAYYANTLARKPFDTEYRLRHHSGKFRWILDRATPRYLEDGTYMGYVGVAYDIQERKEAEEELLQQADYIRSILGSITDGLMALDKEGVVTMWNETAARIFNMQAGEMIGQNVHRSCPLFQNTAGAGIFRNALSQKQSALFEEYIAQANKWVETNVFPFAGGFFVYFRDITKRRRREMLMELQAQALRTGPEPSSLEQAGRIIAAGLEKIFPGIFCSIYEVWEAAGQMTLLTAPSLPAAYCRQNQLRSLAPGEGPGPMAAYTRQSVQLINIMKDPGSRHFALTAAAFGLQSAYAYPVIASDGRILAVLELFYQRTYEADAYELDILQQLASLFGLIMEKREIEEKIKETNERYEFIKSATNEMIWSMDLLTGRLELSDGWTRLFGYQLPEGELTNAFLYDFIHEDDRVKAKSFFTRVPQAHKSRRAEFRLLKADGSYAFVQAISFLQQNEAEAPLRLIGSIKDITRQKKLEQQLFLSEINKQRLINEAMLEGSEKQRSEISKELHDNVNQILSSAKLYLEMALKQDNVQSELATRGIDFIMEGVNEIRKLSHTLAPPGLKQLGLQEAIEEHLRNLTRVHQMKVSFDYCPRIEKAAPEDVKLTVYRIIQEQLNNIVKHARAQVVSIKLGKEKNNLILFIEDDGIGFDLNTVKKGLGLVNIANRTALFRGNATVETSPGNGCRVRVCIPLKS